MATDHNDPIIPAPPLMLGQPFCIQKSNCNVSKIIQRIVNWVIGTNERVTFTAVNHIYGPVRRQKFTFYKANAHLVWVEVKTLNDFNERAILLGLYEDFQDRICDSRGDTIYAWDHPNSNPIVSAPNTLGCPIHYLDHYFDRLCVWPRPHATLVGVSEYCTRSQKTFKTAVNLLGLKMIVTAFPLKYGKTLFRAWTVYKQQKQAFGFG